jgi:hypothetical protein
VPDVATVANVAAFEPAGTETSPVMAARETVTVGPVPEATVIVPSVFWMREMVPPPPPPPELPAHATIERLALTTVTDVELASVHAMRTSITSLMANPAISLRVTVRVGSVELTVTPETMPVLIGEPFLKN